AFPRSQKSSCRRRTARLLRAARCPRPQEEAFDFGTSRLAETAFERGHRPGAIARKRSAQARAPSRRGADQERAGYASSRASRVHDAPPKGIARAAPAFPHDDTTVSRSFAPLSISGHGTFTETVRFYPMDVGLPYVCDDKGDC